MRRNAWKFSPPPQISDPDMHHGMCVTHVPWCMPWSLTSGFLWNRWSGKRSRHSRCMRNSRFYVSGTRPIVISTVPADGIAVLARTSSSTLIAQVGHRTLHTHTPWWHHQTETVSALLVLCAGNSPVTGNSPHKGQWRRALMFSLFCARINDWVNNREAGDLRRHRAHYDVTVMAHTQKNYIHIYDSGTLWLQDKETFDWLDVDMQGHSYIYQ